MSLYVSSDLGFNAKKSLGQNFLISERIAQIITSSIQIDNESILLEIGPGKGFLTERLLHKFNTVLAIEKDYDLANSLTSVVINNYTNHLNNTDKAADVSKFGNISVINSDVIDVNLGKVLIDFEEKNFFSVASNLPYNMALNIIIFLCLQSSIIKDMVLMVQKEFAQKLLAKPRSKEYMPITVLSDLLFTKKKIVDVGRECFRPAPHVTSSVVHFSRNKTIYTSEELSMFYTFLKTSFISRRKIFHQGKRIDEFNCSELIDIFTRQNHKP
jgi:16S rRNA (adenine1518-N6/adenine1519-N6)-dimethyltransferase